MPTLPGTISFRARDGRAVPLLKKGVELPTEMRSTRRLGGWDRSVSVEFVFGENEGAGENTSLGILTLTDLPWLVFAKPKGQVHLSVDENARLTISFANARTGKGVRLRDIDLSSVPQPDPVYHFADVLFDEYFDRQRSFVGNEPLIQAVTALNKSSVRADFHSGHKEILDKYGLTPAQLRAIQEMATSSMYHNYSLRAVMVAVHQAAQIHEQNPDWVLCRQCGGLGIIRQERQTFLGPMINQHGCSRCGGKGFHPGKA